MRNRSVVSVIAAAAALAACGGGGSSPPPSSSLTLSSANYVAAGQEAISAGLQFEESSELIVGAQVSRSDEQSLIQLALAALRRAAPALAAQPPLATGVVITSTASCDNAGGSYTLAGNDANNNNLYDAGDSLTFTFNNCVLGGDSASGTLVVAIKTLSGKLDSNVYNGSFTMTMSNLALSGVSGSYTGSGAIDLTLISTAARTGSSSISASTFTSIGRFGSVQSTRKIESFAVTESHVPEGAGQRTTIRFDGTVTSSGLENRPITLTTNTAFVVPGGGLYPSSGEAVVAGANGGKVRVTAVDSTNVKFELDANGDGSYEASTSRRWQDLL